jgi:hypothetical protein
MRLSTLLAIAISVGWTAAQVTSLSEPDEFGMGIDEPSSEATGSGANGLSECDSRVLNFHAYCERVRDVYLQGDHWAHRFGTRIRQQQPFLTRFGHAAPHHSNSDQTQSHLILGE